jgi:hypothetical protein
MSKNNVWEVLVMGATCKSADIFEKEKCRCLKEYY